LQDDPLPDDLKQLLQRSRWRTYLSENRQPISRQIRKASVPLINLHPKFPGRPDLCSAWVRQNLSVFL